ncbi:MAG: PilZ domain-containing protein [Pseudomonadota bacterium]|nr:PilZ domain-containing protein [Pseudomonadota bacterium]
MAERRARTRQRTFLNGRLTSRNGQSSEDCLVRDLSASGARIELPHPHAPETFELAIPSRGLRASARVTWRRGARLGVTLTAAAAAPAAIAAPDDQRY